MQLINIAVYAIAFLVIKPEVKFGIGNFKRLFLYLGTNSYYMKICGIFLSYLLAAMVFGLVSCKDSKKYDPDQSENQENSEMKIEDNSKREALPEDAAGAGPAAQTGGTTGASNNLKMGTDEMETDPEVNFDDMYDRLGMTDQQIAEFKKALENENPDVTLQDANGEIPGNFYDNLESQLEPILNEGQLKKYRDWMEGKN